MYIPDHFSHENREDAIKLVADYPFATLITHAATPAISHVPLMLKADGTILEGHLGAGKLPV